MELVKSTLRPSIVSRYLTGHDIPRNKGIHAGFQAQEAAQGGAVTITWHLGYNGADMSPEERRDAAWIWITRMERILSERYIVTMFEPAEGYAYHLTVTGKREQPKPTSRLQVEREIRGTARWVHVRGAAGSDSQASRKAGAEARKWARELGKAKAYRVSGGYAQHADGFRYSVCYGFED